MNKIKPGRGNTGRASAFGCVCCLTPSPKGYWAAGASAADGAGGATSAGAASAGGAVVAAGAGADAEAPHAPPVAHPLDSHDGHELQTGLLHAGFGFSHLSFGVRIFGHLISGAFAGLQQFLLPASTEDARHRTIAVATTLRISRFNIVYSPNLVRICLQRHSDALGVNLHPDQ